MSLGGLQLGSLIKGLLGSLVLAVCTVASETSNVAAGAVQCRDPSLQCHALLQKDFVRTRSHARSDVEIAGSAERLASHDPASKPARMSNLTYTLVEQPTDERSLSVSLSTYYQQTDLSLDSQPLRPKVPVDFPISFLHDVVGEDGVITIALERKLERFEFSAGQLAAGGVLATSFAATDAKTATDSELSRGCWLNTTEEARIMCGIHPEFGVTLGCVHKAEQAIAESHRRALVAASLRKSPWTAILEDDMVLVDPVQWDFNFRSAWLELMRSTPDVKIVRLNWCSVQPDPDWTEARPFAEVGNFTLSMWTFNQSTQCTGGYMVRKDILPEMLSFFPCCNPVDNCFFYKLQKLHAVRNGEVVVNMARKNSRPIIEAATNEKWFGQHGVMYQARGQVESEKDQEFVTAPTNPGLRP
mmetsp:Transcript_74934/g.136929  ORF Transcript_74934/g.136929 Transcript_74934/m.136929 type:complete len:415 (+) Transcript_74934:84-1328(+)